MFADLRNPRNIFDPCLLGLGKRTREGRHSEGGKSGWSTHIGVGKPVSWSPGDSRVCEVIGGHVTAVRIEAILMGASRPMPPRSCNPEKCINPNTP